MPAIGAPIQPPVRLEEAQCPGPALGLRADRRCECFQPVAGPAT